MVPLVSEVVEPVITGLCLRLPYCSIWSSSESGNLDSGLRNDQSATDNAIFVSDKRGEGPCASPTATRPSQRSAKQSEGQDGCRNARCLGSGVN
jgi:hypothetical protein